MIPNLQKVRERIEQAKYLSQRTDHIDILLVGKNHSAEEIRPFIQEGIGMIGENRVQEAVQKLPDLNDLVFDKHLIGSLQRNKMNKALEIFDVIQSIESHHQIVELHNKLVNLQIVKKIFIQVNTSGESSKHGVHSLDDVFTMIDEVLGSNYLILQGLMTLGPVSGSENQIRNAFAKLRLFRENIVNRYAEFDSLKLSMGMSNDFEWAIREGSDILRLGSVLFL
ncbi:MAG: YggS family pyridoxal phosphate-dependent enzyme [Brevinemataceae bacterium]